MNFRRNSRSHAPAVQMSSLMDVIFLLLCFFVTSSVFSQWETEVAIALLPFGVDVGDMLKFENYEFTQV